MDRARGYRRGTVMGLTVAEAFMLIAFVLLMLLGVWMASARERIDGLQRRLDASEPFAQAFSEEQKAAALTNRDQLTLLGNNLAKLEAFQALADIGATPSEAAMALQLLPALREGVTTEQLLDRVRLLDEAVLRELAQAAAVLDPDTRAVLSQMAQLEDFPQIAELLRDGGLQALHADLAKLAAFQDILAGGSDPQSAAEVAEMLAAYRATGLSPDDVTRLSAQMDTVTRARLEAAQSRAQIATSLRAEVGPLIAGLGGQVRPDGSIVFRDRLLFEAGSAQITPAFDNALSQLCRPWIEKLYARRDDLAAVRIEGHASSEWISLPPRAAFDRNLDLSQARAAAVFKRCLAYLGDDPIADWGRTRMTAVGYSSSRPILTGAGTEDTVASRRVVFAIDTRSPDLIDDAAQ